MTAPKRPAAAPMRARIGPRECTSVDTTVAQSEICAESTAFSLAEAPCRIFCARSVSAPAVSRLTGVHALAAAARAHTTPTTRLPTRRSAIPATAPATRTRVKAMISSDQAEPMMSLAAEPDLSSSLAATTHVAREDSHNTMAPTAISSGPRRLAFTIALLRDRWRQSTCGHRYGKRRHAAAPSAE